MTNSPCARVLAAIVPLLIGATTIRCSHDSAPAPSGTVAISNVTFVTSAIAAGSTAAGAVTLTAAAGPGGASIALSSSNTSVATVPPSITVAQGQSTATFVVTAVAAGSAIVAASLNGTVRQSPPLTVTAQPALALTSISVSPASVMGGDASRGTVVLNDNAPASGVVVSLLSGDPVTVPASVTVPGGFSNATFSVVTKPVTSTMPVTIQASYGGTTAVTTLTVTAPTVATARFGVTGPTETDTCTLANNGATLNCTFNGSTSTAPGRIVAWDWTYGVATMFQQTTSGAVLTMPAVNCQIIPPPPLPAGAQWFTMEVTLTVRDDRGNVSAKVVNNGIRLIPTGSCGF